MRTIKLGNRDINIAGSPMAPFFYKQEFKQSMTGDVMSLSDIDEDKSKFDDINILQMIWAMEKSAKTGNLESFQEWLIKFDHIDLSDCIEDVVEEAMNATFRSKQKEAQQAKQNQSR